MTTVPTSVTGTTRQRSRRGAALYVAVTATTMIVSVLALTSLSVVRIERKQAAAINTRLLARSHARSAVELALARINSNGSWRTTYSNGGETALQSLGTNSTGSVSWMLRDSDGNLTNADGALRLKGIGRVGSTVQVSSVEVRAGETSALLRSYELLLDLGASEDDLKRDKWWGQYLKPNLPAEANGWRVTSVEIRAKRRDANRAFRVCLYGAGGGSVPYGTLIESVNLNSSSVTTGMSWYGVSFAGAMWLEVGQGIALFVEADSATPIRISYAGGGVSAPNSALLRGDPDWYSTETNKALQYRVYGVYTTSGDVGAVAGTWEWDVP